MTYTSLKRLLYGYAFFDGLMLIYPLYAVMFADYNLSAAQISSLFIVWSLTGFLLEIPSGAIADKFRRKNVLFVALGFKAAAFGFWLFMPNYWGFLIGFLLWGIEGALQSGTQEALVYDELKRVNQSEDYAKVTGRMEGLDIISVVFAGAGAAALASYGYKPILVASIASIVVAAVIIYSLPHAKQAESTGEVKYLDYLREGVQLAITNKQILVLVLLGSFAFGVSAVEEYYNLFFKEQGFNLQAIAFLMGLVYLVGAVASVYAHKLEKAKISPTLLLIIWASILLATALAPPIVSVVGIALFIGVFYVIKILTNTYLQNHLNDKTRATTTSVGGFLAEIFALMVFGIFIVTEGSTGYSAGLQVLAVIIALAALIGIAARKRYNLTLAVNK